MSSDVRPNLVDRLFLLLDGMQGPPSLNLYALGLSGEWDFALLRTAMADLLAEQPLLRTRAHRGRFTLAREALPEQDVDAVFEVGPPGDGAGFGCAAEREFMRRPLDLATAAPIRVMARPGRIVMGLHHSVADGIGGYFVLDRLAAHYAARLAGVPVEPPPQAPPRAYRSYFARFTPAERRQAVLGIGNVLRELWLPLGPYATFGDLPLPARGQFAWKELLLPESHVPALRAAARQQGGTLNDLLLAATAAAGSATWPQDPKLPLLVMVPASLRDGPAVDMTNRVAEMPILLPGEDCRDFAGAFAKARELTPLARDRARAFARVCQYGLVSKLPPGLVRWILARAMDRAENHGLTYVFSNTGVLDPQPRDFGPVVVQSVAGMPPLTMPPGLGVVAATARGRLTLTIAWSDPALASERIEAFSADLYQRLDVLAKQAASAQ